MVRIQNVDLEEEAISNVEAVEWNSFDQCDVTDIFRLAIVHIAPEADSKRMIDRKLKPVDVRLNYCV